MTGEEQSGFFAPAEAPDTVGRGFTDVEPLGGGGSAYTRLHAAQRRGKRFVLKSLRAECRADPVARGLLEKEFEVGYALDHAGVVQTYGLEEVEGLGTAIVLEWIDGETLAEALRQGRIEREQGRRIVQELAEAVDYLHSKQVMHRDLKPTNIMLTRGTRRVKVIDFGLSDGAAYATLKQPAGTRGYAAPEQERAGADGRADVYGLGRVAMEIAEATGDRRLKRLARRCCAADPERRPSQASAVAWMPRRRGTAWVAWTVAAVALGTVAWLATGTPAEGTRVEVPVEVPVAVHDTIVVEAPVDSARLAFKTGMQGRIERIVERGMEAWIKSVEAGTAKCCQPPYRWGDDIVALQNQLMAEVTAFVQKNVPTGDPEYPVLHEAAMGILNRKWGAEWGPVQERLTAALERMLDADKKPAAEASRQQEGV